MVHHVVRFPLSPRERLRSLLQCTIYCLLDVVKNLWVMELGVLKSERSLLPSRFGSWLGCSSARV
jgi:hypothetical protein